VRETRLEKGFRFVAVLVRCFVSKKGDGHVSFSSLILSLCGVHSRERPVWSCGVVNWIGRPLISPTPSPGHRQVTPRMNTTRALPGEKYGVTQPDIKMLYPPVRSVTNDCARHTIDPKTFFSFFFSWVSKTQPNHWTKRMANTRLAT